MKKAREIMIGSKLKELRKSYGYTQEQLAEAIECSVRYIGNIEQNKSKPSYEVLIRICNLFNIGLDNVFSQYLQTTNKKAQNIGLYGFENLKPKNQATILYLIEYFNKTNG